MRAGRARTSLSLANDIPINLFLAFPWGCILRVTPNFVSTRDGHINPQPPPSHIFEESYLLEVVPLVLRFSLLFQCISCCGKSYLTIPCRVVQCRVVSCRIVLYRVVSCRALPCCTVPYVSCRDPRLLGYKCKVIARFSPNDGVCTQCMDGGICAYEQYK